ncbi:YndJ family protein [Psychrobacillus sp. FSL K6-4046]|uniref:YndJ family protein n=1 Tax=Psychrobacillus sp. FSL K6-4046 TaxID=2921550 RepID=UPI00315A524C
MTYKRIAISHTILFLIVAAFSVEPWYFLMLSVAQILFVPLVLKLVLKDDHLIYYFVIPAVIAVSILQITEDSRIDSLLALIYLLFTFIIAMVGFKRFINRGFTNIEEFAIDMGMMYLFIGGLWFVASVLEIDTGFTPILTWLTGIHFHYSSFLLPVFIGFLGRVYKPASYPWLTAIILISPLVVAIGITFSTLLEFISVLLYMIGIYGSIVLAIKATYKNGYQKSLIVTSFGALGVTILFSLLYATGNAFGIFGVTIDFMLKFHGFFNCLIFAFVGIVGWSIWTPPELYKKLQFPISKIKGKGTVGEKVLGAYHLNKNYTGLVDDMSIFVDKESLPPMISNFYEQTMHYRLFSTVHWHAWFKPFAALYRLFSSRLQQLNLPFTSREMEMTGDIVAIEDGRTNTRAWIRKIETSTIFVALYSIHTREEKTFMNISLPLPWSSMVGVLALEEQEGKLLLTSKSTLGSDAGIYLAFRGTIFKLPLEEQFLLEENNETLTAKHEMRIFSIPFLTINYRIFLKEDLET